MGWEKIERGRERNGDSNNVVEGKCWCVGGSVKLDGCGVAWCSVRLDGRGVVFNFFLESIHHMCTFRCVYIFTSVVCVCVRACLNERLFNVIVLSVKRWCGGM